MLVKKTGLSKLITQLNNWFKDIMLSFRESKLQGLKHLAFAFGEVLLGIGAIVATIAAFVVALPVMTASLGVNIATRAANFMAGVCVGLFAALYKICAVLNGSVGLFYNDSKAEEFHRNASKTKGEMINLMKEFFKKAFENPKASIDNAKDKAEKN